VSGTVDGSDVPERRVVQRRTSYGESRDAGNAKWLMGIVAALFGGVLLGWYNDVRELRPDVAVLKTEMRLLTDQVRTTNQRLETLTTAIVTQNERAEGRVR
jgi:hypothetical protein